jgi:hypothetical protein
MIDFSLFHAYLKTIKSQPNDVLCEYWKARGVLSVLSQEERISLMLKCLENFTSQTSLARQLLVFLLNPNMKSLKHQVDSQIVSLWKTKGRKIPNWVLPFLDFLSNYINSDNS